MINDFLPYLNSEVVAFRFDSESEFDKAVDRLYAKQKPFEVAGFNVLLIPCDCAVPAEKILKTSRLKFDKVGVISTADLTDKQRAILRKVQDSNEDDSILAFERRVQKLAS